MPRNTVKNKERKRKQAPAQLSNLQPWRPGQSGNAAGRPKAPADKAEYIREVQTCTWGALTALWDIVNDEGAADADRIRAGAELLQRGWGNAPVELAGKLEFTGDDALLTLLTRLAGDGVAPATLPNPPMMPRVCFGATDDEPTGEGE